MIDGQTLRRDTDVLPFTHPHREARIEQLRQHLASREARMLGIDETYSEDDHTVQSALLRTLGAAFATTTLLVTVGALALPAAAFA